MFFYNLSRQRRFFPEFPSRNYIWRYFHWECYELSRGSWPSSARAIGKSSFLFVIYLPTNHSFHYSTKFFKWFTSNVVFYFLKRVTIELPRILDGDSVRQSCGPPWAFGIPLHFSNGSFGCVPAWVKNDHNAWYPVFVPGYALLEQRTLNYWLGRKSFGGQFVIHKKKKQLFPFATHFHKIF